MRSSVLLFTTLLALSAWARELDIRPAPAWVETLSVDTNVVVEKKNVRWGLYDILQDHQVRVANGNESQYFRTVRKVLSPSGVQNTSELELDFDPSFERLTLHEVVILRNGLPLDAYDVEDIRVIEKEDESDRRIYDGERTALIFLKDVRAGDVIDYSWSIDGANPILSGRYTDEYDLSSGVPAKQIRHSLLWPAGRPLQWRGGDPAIGTAAEMQSFVWERRDVAPLSIDDEIPSWFEPWESIQVTEFASWNEVAVWASSMFRLDERSTREVKALAARITAEHATREGRITAAIRFVQDDIRYLGIEMGRNSHEPHQPWETLDSRWGDCKDKSLLLVALLRELGLEAYPALVNTRLRRKLADKLPTAFLFDHVIAQVIDGGKTYWIDGTMSDQGGTLATIESTPGEELALVVRPETTGLTKMDVNMRGGRLVEQTYRITDFTQPTTLEVKTTYTGANADSMRSTLASLAVEDYAADRLNDLAIDQPKIEADGEPRITDDRHTNTIVITERYRIRELWQDGHWTWWPRVIEQHLLRPDTTIRSMPLAFAYPLNVEQKVTFHFPEEMSIDKVSTVTENETFRYEYVVDGSGKSVWIRQSLRAKRDFVEAEGVADHLTKLSGIWSEFGYRLAPAGAKPRAPKEPMSPLVKWIAGFFAVAVFVGIALALATRRRRAPVVTFRPGEAPASALPVSLLETHLAEIGCHCGASLLYAAKELQRARYDEREMTIVTRQCGVCGREQNVYFTAA